MVTIKIALTDSLIWIFPNANEHYVLFTDVSKYGWSAVLIHENITTIKGKETISGAFVGSQKNLATLTKEDYAIYMASKKLSYYLYDAKVTIKCEHVPLCFSLYTNLIQE